MSEYFAARMTNAAIEVINLGLRDLRSADLAPFYAGEAVPASKAASDLESARDASRRAGEGSLPEDVYRRQAGPPNPLFFQEFMDTAGIELTFTADLTTSTPIPKSVSAGNVGEFLSERSDYQVPSRQARSLTLGAVRHLRIPDQYQVAVSDFTRGKVSAARQYIRRYLAPK